jgi:hypothetical protein
MVPSCCRFHEACSAISTLLRLALRHVVTPRARLDQNLTHFLGCELLAFSGLWAKAEYSIATIGEDKLEMFGLCMQFQAQLIFWLVLALDAVLTAIV